MDDIVKQELAELKSQFLVALEQLRPRLGTAWSSLHDALKDTLEALQEPFSEVDYSPSNSSWQKELECIDEDAARDLSRELIRLSDALKACYRLRQPRERHIADAIAVLYMNVQRPLWTVYPDLRPFEVSSG